MKRAAIVGAACRWTAETYWNVFAAETSKLHGAGATPLVLLHGYHATDYSSFLAAQNWDRAAEFLRKEISGAESFGAEGVLICGSELNAVAAELRRAIDVPVIDMGLSVSELLRSFNVRRVGLIGGTKPRVEAMWRESLREFRIVMPQSSDLLSLAQLSKLLTDCSPIPSSALHLCRRVVAEFVRKGATAVVVENHILSRFLKAQESPLLPQIDAATTHAWKGALWTLGHDITRAQSLPPHGLDRIMQ